MKSMQFTKPWIQPTATLGQKRNFTLPSLLKHTFGLTVEERQALNNAENPSDKVSSSAFGKVPSPLRPGLDKLQKKGYSFGDQASTHKNTNLSQAQNDSLIQFLRQRNNEGIVDINKLNNVSLGNLPNGLMKAEFSTIHKNVFTYQKNGNNTASEKGIVFDLKKFKGKDIDKEVFQHNFGKSLELKDSLKDFELIAHLIPIL